jgi:hypothetical protein
MTHSTLCSTWTFRTEITVLTPNAVRSTLCLTPTTLEVLVPRPEISGIETLHQTFYVGVLSLTGKSKCSKIFRYIWKVLDCYKIYQMVNM